MTKTPLFTPVLIAGCVVLMIGFAIRASFGVFQNPIAEEFNWARSEFSLAIAIQNLAWGIGQPIFGALAEKFGDRRAIVAGALMYSAGLLLSSYAVTPGQMQLLEILVGFGIAGSGFGTLYGFVFLSHQLGSFLGVRLGGKMFDLTGDCTLVWWIGVGLGAFSAIVHLPIREKPLMAQAA